MRPALTRRGVVVLGVALAATASGWLFGARSLNAVAVPTAVALAVTGWLVYRAEVPDVVRDPPADGHAGETHEVGVRVEGSRTMAVTVRDALGDGLDGDATVRTVADGRDAGYAVTYRERGRHTVGPARVTVADPLGLWTRTFEAGSEHVLTVYPRVLALTAPPRALAGSTGWTEERGEFAGVREYRHGDPLRDVNWKASAKRPDEYVVTTYADEGTDATLTIAVEVTDGGDPDRAAVAAASLLDACLDTGAAVGLRTPAETLAPASGDSHRRRALGALAVLGHGALPSAAREDARVAVRGDATGVHVTVDDDRRAFDAMADAADAEVGA